MTAFKFWQWKIFLGFMKLKRKISRFDDVQYERSLKNNNKNSKREKKLQLNINYHSTKVSHLTIKLIDWGKIQQTHLMLSYSVSKSGESSAFKLFYD